VLANSSKDKHFNTIFTMTTTVRHLITVLKMFFPGELPLKRAIYILVAVMALYPILQLHTNQVTQPRQPKMTAWLKSIGVFLMRAFHPEELDLIYGLIMDPDSIMQRICIRISMSYTDSLD
jgi:hypothetical protein